MLPLCFAPAAGKCLETAAGRAAAVALLPLLALAAVVSFGYISMEDISKSVDVVSSCACARNYALGGLVLYGLAIKAAYNSVKPPLPKDGSLEKPIPEPPSKKLAAKAA